MASKRRLRRNACTGKIRYSEDDAVRFAQISRGNGKRLNAYKCEFCHQWHVGHPNAKNVRAIKQREGAYRKSVGL